MAVYVGQNITFSAPWSTVRSVGLTAAALRVWTQNASGVKQFLQWPGATTWNAADSSVAATVAGGNIATYNLAAGLPQLPAGCFDVTYEFTPTPAHLSFMGGQQDVEQASGWKSYIDAADAAEAAARASADAAETAARIAADNAEATARANGDAATLLAATQYAVSLDVQPATARGRAIIAGDTINIVASLVKASTGVRDAVSSNAVALYRKGFSEYLNGSGVWTATSGATAPSLRSMTLSDSNRINTLAIATDASWGVEDVVAVVALVGPNGTTYCGAIQIPFISVGSAADHFAVAYCGATKAGTVRVFGRLYTAAGAATTADSATLTVRPKGDPIASVTDSGAGTGLNDGYYRDVTIPTPLSTSQDYEVVFAFVKNGATYYAYETITAAFLLSSLEYGAVFGNGIQFALSNAQRLAALAAERFNATGGIPAQEDAWEDTLRDPTLTDPTQATTFAARIGSQYAPQKTITVIDRRPPEFFAGMGTYRLRTGGRGLEGDYPIVNIQPVEDAGGRKTRLTLNRLKANATDDAQAIAARVENVERA